MKKLKASLQIRFPMLASDIIKVLLSRREMDLACYMTAFYNIWLEKEHICQAVEFRWLKWVQYVFAFNKNFLSNDPDEEPDLREPITFKKLFGVIDQYYKNEGDDVSKDILYKEIVNCCKWKLDMDENILEALLFHNKDQIALDYLGVYSKFLDNPHGSELFLYSISHKNDRFTKEVLQKEIFDKQIFKEDNVVACMIEMMEDGSKTNFILNTLNMIDISVWRNERIEQLLEMFGNFTDEIFEKNRLLLSYNPLMSIALSAELCQKIS